MQEKHYDGLVGPVEEAESMMQIGKALADEHVESVEVFKKDSQAHKDAEKVWGELTSNQKRKVRRRLKNRK